jgi:hypothetical protein
VFRESKIGLFVQVCSPNLTDVPILLNGSRMINDLKTRNGVSSYDPHGKFSLSVGPDDLKLQNSAPELRFI